MPSGTEAPYTSAGAASTLDPQLDAWFIEGMAENLPSHEATHSFEESSPAEWIDRIGAPTLLIQGLPDTVFNLNEGVHNYLGLRDHGVDVRLVGLNTGHLLPGLQPTGAGHALRAEESPCADLPTLVDDFLAHHLRGDSAAAARLADVPRVVIPTEQGDCISGPDWPLTDEELTFTFPAFTAPQPGGSLLLPLMTADEPVTLAGIPRLIGTPLHELDDQLYLSLVVADADGLHVIDDQVTGMRLRAGCDGYAEATCMSERGVPHRAELGGIATTLAPGQQLLLRVEGWNEQHALNSTRRPGAALLTSVTLTVPVLSN
ncbi:MAG: hypothetical protein KY469_10015 [Actinobacteria bacterium]|nr:hypothetical protein [Actinomycetota bacterium]